MQNPHRCPENITGIELARVIPDAIADDAAPRQRDAFTALRDAPWTACCITEARLMGSDVVVFR
jgi:hypothetical protein